MADFIDDDYESYEECIYEDDPFYYDNKYLYDYQWYHEKFPERWAINHKNDSGPGKCENCSEYGCVNGVFIGYCANCALYIYNGTRGRGFIDSGVENNNEDVLKYESAFETYLLDVDITTITEPGLEVINDNEELYEDNTDISVLNCHYEGGYNDF